MSENYDYDLAISYESSYEVPAKTIYNKLKTSFKVFFAPQRQSDLAFRNGLDELSKIFEKAKFVVVVYSELWGSTPFTRVERNKIEERFLKESHDFLFFIKADNAIKPPWLPDPYFYFNLKQYSIGDAITIIESRVIERGAMKKEETPVDISQRIKREQEEQRKKERFINFPGDAQSKALIEYERFLQFLKDEIEIINKTPDTIKIKNIYLTEYYPVHFRIVIYPLEVLIYYQYNATNVLEGSYLDYKIINTRKAQPSIIKSEQFTFDYNEFQEFGWNNKNKFYSSESLVTYLLKELLRQFTITKD